jgi:AcrR family transcriptional regulator
MYVTNGRRVKYSGPMDAPARPRSTRDRPAKAPLSEDAIVDAALAIVRAEGLDAVTMRRVATELDTGPASLYVYIRGRDELRNAMLDRVGSLIELEEPDPARWREQVHALLDRTLAALEDHPGIASVAVANPPSSPRVLRFAENLLGLLLAGGVTAPDAALACDSLPLLTTATALETDAWRAQGNTRETDVADVADRLFAAFTSLPPDAFPLLTRYSRELIVRDGDERFHFAVDTFLDGLVARAARA